ncbi:hypothetical protein Droror1_Dr00014392 [Drosera rotundifolia]
MRWMPYERYNINFFCYCSGNLYELILGGPSYCVGYLEQWFTTVFALLCCVILLCFILRACRLVQLCMCILCILCCLCSLCSCATCASLEELLSTFKFVCPTWIKFSDVVVN